MMRLRALWRRWFQPWPPVRLDGSAIQMRTTFACAARGQPWSYEEWLKQRDIRADENRRRDAAWARGERV